MTSRQLCNVSEKVASAYQSQLTSFLTDQRNIAKLISFLTSLGLTVTMGNNNMLLPIITGATGYALTTSILKALKDTKDFSLEYKRQLIRGSQEYHNCVDLYDSLVEDIAHFFRYLNLKDSLDIGLFYQCLLYNGFLSYNGDFNYHKYNYDGGICPEIYGARISSGTGVCRHIATNLKDIYEKMGFTASYLSVGGAKSTWVSNVKTRIMPSSINHAVVCVKDTYGKYIIDPTWEKVATFDNDDKFAHIIGNTEKDSRYVIGYTTLINRRHLLNYDSYVGVRKSPSAILDTRDVNQSYEFIMSVFYSQRSRILDFYQYISRKLEQISFYEQKIANYHDVDQVSNLVLTKQRF